jgi:hypothetical protein
VEVINEEEKKEVEKENEEIINPYDILRDDKNLN